ncbi:MAG TPA: 6-phosphogluconolactonase [Candidatus Limnocylindrales bacterium]
MSGRDSRPQVVVVADRAALARTAAQQLVAALGEAIDRRGEAHLALTGGSTALPLYEELAAGWRDALDWQRVHLWWGDERLVPADHPESNAGLAYAALLGYARRAAESGSGGQGTDIAAGDVPGLPVPAENVHPWAVDEALAETEPGPLVAQAYAEELARYLPAGAAGLPGFDVILLGVGPDGHVLSVFPGSPALAGDAPLALAVPAPQHVEPHIPRLTINPRLITAAQGVIVMVAGAAKADIVARILESDAAPADLPARLAVAPNATWLLDQAAGARTRSTTAGRQA